MKDQIAHKRLNTIWMQSFTLSATDVFFHAAQKGYILGIILTQIYIIFSTNICWCHLWSLLSHWLLFSLQWNVNTWKNVGLTLQSAKTFRYHSLWSCFPLSCHMPLTSVILVSCMQLNSVPVCLQCLLYLTPKYWSSVLSSAHISPWNRHALLNKHHTHSISQPAPSFKAIIIYLELCLF